MLKTVSKKSPSTLEKCRTRPLVGCPQAWQCSPCSGAPQFSQRRGERGRRHGRRRSGGRVSCRHREAPAGCRYYSDRIFTSHRPMSHTESRIARGSARNAGQLRARPAVGAGPTGGHADERGRLDPGWPPRAHTLAAVTVGSSIWTVALLLCVGVLMAIPPSVSQLNGAGRRREIGPLWRQAVLDRAGHGPAADRAGLAFAALARLRSASSPRFARRPPTSCARSPSARRRCRCISASAT